MSEIALEFDGVWKKFKKGEIHDSLRDLVPAFTKGVFSRNHRGELDAREFWALRDIGFQVRRGEALGIIGANGAGKSTILKLLSRIMRPSRGRIRVGGRVSCLIEVGAGFHPDLTGRENVYLNGSILGMKREEIARKFDEIVAFAGVGDFIDTPVKRYSSGMYARLGFAVAAHVDPDILLVDEVLSVGDMQFQERCFERMRRVVARGTTVIFVSHNLQAVQTICDRAILLNSGCVALTGPTSEVIGKYLCAQADGPVSELPGSISGISLRSENGEAKANFCPGERAQLRFTVRSSEPLEECLLVLLVHRATDGLVVCEYNLPLAGVVGSEPHRGGDIPLTVDLSMNLLRGVYAISIQIYHARSARFLGRADRVASLFVEETLSWQGVSHIDPVVRNECA
ncbi:MAG TPA: polysaccharide ABC transporter ATP-binding protein [Terriglobia bacterium]|nr:polysaccharide ABC transporter ATP-binding protein [Terriglobia bacterium]